MEKSLFQLGILDIKDISIRLKVSFLNQIYIYIYILKLEIFLNEIENQLEINVTLVSHKVAPPSVNLA